MKKRGITLVELIICIALVSLIMVFLIRMLVDLKYSDENRTYADLNQVNRATIIHEIENDLMNQVLTGIEDKSVADKGSFLFHFQDGSTKTLDILESTIAYEDLTWKMKGRNNSTHFSTNCYPFSYVEDTREGTDISENYSIRIGIPVTVGASVEDSIDDIEISYLGKKSDLTIPFPSKAYFGYDTTSCTN